MTDDILIARLMEDACLTLDELAANCAVDAEWVIRHVDEGQLPRVSGAHSEWRFTSSLLLRARRIRALERDFEAVPELAALVADLLEEMDALRARLAHRGLRR